jgi:two-component system, OmpR family, sensor kinase
VADRGSLYIVEAKLNATTRGQASSDLGAASADSRPAPGWYERARTALTAAGSVRMRILGPFVVLLALAAMVPFIGYHQVVLGELENEVNNELQQEVLELDQLLTDGRDPQTGQPFTSLTALFDVYFSRNVPSREEAFLSFVDGALHRSSTLTGFPLDRLPTEALAEWEALANAEPGAGELSTGRIETALGDAYFRAARIRFQDDVGAFVVTILPASERAAIDRFLILGGLGSLLVLLAASVAAWLIAGRVLEPIRQLTDTARSISSSDLTGRIEVRGTGEAAQMARSFNAMLDRLESVFQGEREFVQDASHELREPMTIVRGYVELWETDPDERQRTAQRALDELDRMGRIVDDLRLLAEAEQPGFLRLEWLDLGDLTRELASKAEALATRGWQVESAGGGRFLADRHRLTEAVMNLVHNAVQHTVESDTIAIAMEAVDRMVRISVRDTGAGIPVGDQALIFGRFARGSGAHLRYGGSGLGLAIVTAVATAHGGRVDLESRLGEGSTFTILIPRDPTEGAIGGQDPDR